MCSAAALLFALCAATLTACGDDTAESAGRTQIGVILPDSKTSARWERADRKYLQQVFEELDNGI
jgi:D-xylose transport system substrate-binding protein